MHRVLFYYLRRGVHASTAVFQTNQEILPLSLNFLTESTLPSKALYYMFVQQ